VRQPSLRRLAPPLAGLLAALSGCAAQKPQGGGLVLLASTIGPVEAGIVPALEDRFERETGIRVRHVGAGTGEALRIAEGGSVDLVLVHARSLEEKFVAAGYGTGRIPLMYNDFVIVGPAEDPAGVKGAAGAAQALRAIAAKEALVVTRGDRSGTHVAELELWGSAGLEPSGAWYRTFEKGSEGNAATLRFTDQQRAYTVIDRATWLSLRPSLQLVVLREGDRALLNVISLIPVNAARFPKVNRAGAERFVRWLTSPSGGQAVIEAFGRDRYGEPLFFPDSTEWKAARPR
jgi:tungstate transport system substrate-binding protein